MSKGSSGDLEHLRVHSPRSRLTTTLFLTPRGSKTASVSRSGLLDLPGTSRTMEFLLSREDCSDMGSSQLKVIISQMATAVGVQDPSAVPSLPQDGVLSTNNTSCVDTPQLNS